MTWKNIHELERRAEGVRRQERRAEVRVLALDDRFVEHADVARLRHCVSCRVPRERRGRGGTRTGMTA